MEKFKKPSNMTDSETKRWEALVARIRITEKAMNIIEKEDYALDERHENEMDALYQKHQKENDHMMERLNAAEDKQTDLMKKLDELEDKMLERKDRIIASQRKK